MNHRKIRSEGYIPFSWEEKPGIPKINHHKSSSDMGMRLDDIKMMSKNLIDKKAEVTNKKIAPPPPCTQRKSYYRKGLQWQDDPFLAALKYCSKGDMFKEKNLISKSSLFSCKHSCNVVDDNLVKFSKLPPIPKERYYSRSFVRNSK